MRYEMRREPLFVVGIWRSGTSLLYALLNQHSQIALLYEGDLPPVGLGLRTRRLTYPLLERLDLRNGVLARHHLDLKRIGAAVGDSQTIAEVICKEYARQKGATIWGDKSPNYCSRLSTLGRHFPKARFIVIWRNPINICGSILRAAAHDTWFARIGMTHRGLLGYSHLRRECDRLLAQGFRVHQVQYESLTRDTVREMRNICKFLDVPFDAKMASLQDADRSAIFAGEHHRLVRSEKIVASREHLNDIPPALRRKIERYVCLWREKSNGRWPTFPAPTARSGIKPSLLETCLDDISYNIFQSYDLVVRLIYEFAPLSLLRKYEGLKARRANTMSEDNVLT